MSKLTSPKEFFGAVPGSDRTIIRWDKICDYFDLLQKESGCISVTDMGPSTEGNRFLKVIITSENNMKNLEKYRKMSMALSDPRGLSQDKIDQMVKNGKAVCVQSMSLHATEIGGTQMAPQLAYDLLLADTEEKKSILENVIFVMVPCFNPDGQIMVCDWYNKYLGTENEGVTYPSLYHKYTGHDNNRDAFAQNIVESRYMGQIIFKEWMPQSYQDHHHMGSYGARLFIAPYKEPIRPYTDPLIWRELSLYGANMAYKCEEEGIAGIANSTQYPGWGHYGYHWITNSHNIAGMLTESASAKLATPLYIHPTQLQGDGDLQMPTYEARTYFPHPWEGGWWKLSDIVRQQYTVAMALLDTMAKNRKQILKNMAQKALRQTERGANDPVKAFIIPKDQHDTGTMHKLINILLGQNIEVKVALSAITVGSVMYPAGSFVVMLSQPKYGVIKNLLERTFYPDSIYTRNKDGAFTAFDVAADTVAEYMGVTCIPAMGEVQGRLKTITDAPHVDSKVEKASAYVISAKENDAFALVNKLFKKGIKVYRIDTCPWHDFYVENVDERDLEGFKYRTADKKYPLTEIKPAKVALYQRYYSGNADEGWTRLVLENFGFEYKTVFDKDIINGALNDVDVLILPKDKKEMLIGPKNIKNDPAIEQMLMWVGKQPEEYQSGLGDEGAAKIREFVEKGGKLLAFNESSLYAIDVLNLGIKNVVDKVPLNKFNTHGSTLRVSFDTEDNAAYGMPKNGYILHWDGPVFAVKDRRNAENYKCVVTYPKKDILQSGLLTGEEYLSQNGAMVRAECGKGEAILYGFAPLHRAQTHGTFKLVFNELYK